MSLPKPRKTPRQREIMGIILREANAGRFLRAVELQALMKTGASITTGAVRVSLRFLEEKGMLVRFRSGSYMYYKPTSRGYDWFRPLA